MNTPQDSSLGREVAYPSQYDPALLFPIPRRAAREEIGVDEANLPFVGHDRWQAYELSWLDRRGKPRVAVATISVPCTSPNLIESKSFKLYLNSLNQSPFADAQALTEVLVRDLSAVAGAPVAVRVRRLDEVAVEGVVILPGACIDEMDIAVSDYSQPRPELLACDTTRVVEQTLYSHLLKSNCPVTGQPDWGTLVVDYRGPALHPASLLAYVASFRQHQDFHEQCVERIFLDLLHLLQPEKLTVYARYVRRGGLDINPYRSLHALEFDNRRLVRQ